ncbi:hypothetical protein, partial [Nocardioides sp.]|uniref:hypothetical protein n=1 Tax=Nocardioides sp. TaxID=35761 RepID=UPI003568CDD2
GVAARPTESGGTVGRLLEVVTAPPASVATDAATPVAGDSYARASLAVPLRTAELLHAAAAAIVSHNTDAGRGTRHLTIAVGAGKPATAGALLANRSELIRLRDLEGVALEEVRARLKTAPLNPAGGSGSTPGPLAGLALRALAPRLGSTLLVSHLGEVTASAVSDLAFYPVTSGGTGLSLGAVHHRGATTLTLRGRAARWTDEALGVLLARVTAQISRP